MDTIAKCAEVIKLRGWTQRELARELGLTEQNMTHVMKGRRDLPAHALAKLERLRGTDDRAIVDMIIKQAACVALTAVLLLVTGVENRAFASSGYATQVARNADSPGLGYRSHWGNFPLTPVYGRNRKEKRHEPLRLLMPVLSGAGKETRTLVCALLTYCFY